MKKLDIEEAIQDFDTFLLDAAGVLYVDKGVPCPGSIHFLARLKKLKKNIFVVTNNSSFSTKEISTKFQSMGFDISQDMIISSGQGLAWDPDISKLIKEKKVYPFGLSLIPDYENKKSCLSYIGEAGGKLCHRIEMADAIVLLTSFNQNNKKMIEELSRYWKKQDIPCICTNPDIYIWRQKCQYPVVGFYAKKIEQRVGKQMIWLGKPFQNFSNVVKLILSKKNIDINKRVCFFDDNYENTRAMQSHLGIVGCCVTETGLSQKIDFEDMKKHEPDALPDFFIPNFADSNLPL